MFVTAAGRHHGRRRSPSRHSRRSNNNDDETVTSSHNSTQIVPEISVPYFRAESLHNIDLEGVIGSSRYGKCCQSAFDFLWIIPRQYNY